MPLPTNTDHFTGELTYYGTGLGACGVTSTDNDAIVSVSHYLYDAVQTGSDPNQNPLCGKKIRATRVDERSGKQVSIDVKVVDRCKFNLESVRLFTDADQVLAASRPTLTSAPRCLIRWLTMTWEESR